MHGQATLLIEKQTELFSEISRISQIALQVLITVLYCKKRGCRALTHDGIARRKLKTGTIITPTAEVVTDGS
jgi:hypothetical protein